MRSFLRTAASLLIAVIAVTAVADWRQVKKDVSSIQSKDKVVSTLANRDEVVEDEDFYEMIQRYQEAKSQSAKDKEFKSITEYLNSLSRAEGFETAPGAKEAVTKIKKDPVYLAERESKASNWIEKMRDRIEKALNRQEDKSPRFSSSPTIVPWISSLITFLFYALIAVVVFLLIYIIVKVPWSTIGGKGNRIKRGGMIEEGENILTEDEYLVEADRLIAAGRYREACRALYLASLLRIDAARIARFEPTQTNWEHLRRIETSRTKPEGFEFRPVTKAFDHAWYGYTANSAEDVSIFRETYIQIKTLSEQMV